MVPMTAQLVPVQGVAGTWRVMTSGGVLGIWEASDSGARLFDTAGVVRVSVGNLGNGQCVVAGNPAPCPFTELAHAVIAGRCEIQQPVPDTAFYRPMRAGHLARKGHALAGYLVTRGGVSELVRTCCETS